ncbi:MAG: dihydrofolate reductase, partial [Tannerella sp.]|nr:dihydrofolate reductase [Tannerella sp.]
MRKIAISMMIAVSTTACVKSPKNEMANNPAEAFNYVADRFADIEVLRYQAPGFEALSLGQKQLLYHLSEAALMGRDILYDQNNQYNLAIRRTLEAIYLNYTGDRENARFKALETYLKRVWFANGIHHHYAEDKFVPGFAVDFFTDCVSGLDASLLPLRPGQTIEQWLAEIIPVMFQPDVMPKRTVQSGDGDLITASANNYYGEGVTMNEVEAFYAGQKAQGDTIRPISYGLNSRLVKENGRLTEKVWKVGGL